MKKWLFFLAVALFGGSCTLSGQSEKSVRPAEFLKLIEPGGNIQVLDVRTAEEFRAGYLKGALQADWLNKKEFTDRTKHLD
ncbi:rhodanese-like domain-containing protein, partial [Flavihumibacter sp. CACIAM 22H1]|uniref:rhodanese-like domain-containing protein n=1 Tax=Flavihumibacter sp. CACIAM 22H1 TaxID=1812911 RepID=UPI000A853DB6